MAHRPLSPFLNYRFAYTMLLSFMHRIAGCTLSLGFILLVLWLMSAAQGRGSFDRFAAVAGSGPVQAMIALGVFAFVFHFANGIRHLFWDIGWGLERAQARRSAAVVVLLTVLAATALVYMLFLRGRSA
jgi:succinate dehydrogenase / fumarate reductase, cytochrome b subunit